MRNLRVHELNEFKLDLDNGLPITSTAFDANTNDLICTLGPAPGRPIIELRRFPAGLGDPSRVSLITSWDAPSPLPDLPCDSVLSLHYFHETSTACLVLEGGDLIFVREKPLPDQERIEIVGSIDVGIAAAQWSWNASALAVVTRVGTLVLMTRQLDTIGEVSFSEDDLKLSKHVSVGWGKKETQFQGKRAKAMKDPTMPEFVDEGKPSPHDDGRTSVSWRGDGAYVAVNSNLSSSRRVVRVYNADGILDSVSEPVDGLESSLAWRPHGNLIASIKRTTIEPQNLEVVFFERNGLRHGQFDLRLTPEELHTIGSKVSLAYNQDSSVLAVRFTDRIQLWTMGNYHHYLKQEFCLKSTSGTIWHPTNPLALAISNNTTVQALSLVATVDGGSTTVPFDYGLVMVVDGKKLKVTPLRHANVPPPMSFLELEADENIIACAASRTSQRIAFLTNFHLYLCRLDLRSTGAKDGSLRHAGTFAIQKKNLSMFPRPTQLVIQHDDEVHLFSPARSTTSFGQAFCHKFVWVHTTGANPDLMTSDVQISRRARQIHVDQNHSNVWIGDGASVVPVQDDVVGNLPTFDGSNLSESVSNIVELQSDGITSQVAVSTSADGRLLVNGASRAEQVTSFATTDAHIIFTTSNHLLKFVHLKNAYDIEVPPDTPEADERCRAIERGAKIVAVIPSTYAVILQMPRGNLETIFPRILVLSGIREHIRNLDYRKAFIACLTHQVDLNILYDYDPSLWKSNISVFVDQLKKPGRIDEFLQKLREEDVTHTLYRDTSKTEPAMNGTAAKAPVSTTPLKVNKICDNIIDILRTKGADYTTNVITAHVCKRPADLDAALLLVSDLHQTSAEEADIAIAHLCFLTDTNRLFDAALALYDLNLTLLVAQNAQRDPREYMPFLQELQALPELRRQYRIDHHLKRYNKALSSLHALGEHDEAKTYMVKYSLYDHAERLYQRDQAELPLILRLHAEYLATQSQHSSAAILYESLGDYTAAYPLYVLAHQWREALSCAALLPVDGETLESLARSLASTCREENRDYRAAATIHLDYLAEPVVAAELLCKASYFAEATRILSMPGRNLSSQISAVVDTALTRKFGEILELVADCQTQLQSQVPRIEELRVKKAEDPLAFYGGDTAGGDGVDIPDNVSLAATDTSTLGGQSMFTRYGGGAGGSQASTKFAGTVASNMSRKTSKTKRREERKRARGKKGSVYEEEYLISSVARLIERVNGAHEEVRRLVSGMRKRGLREQAVKVEEVMIDVEQACIDARERIWPKALKEDINTYDVDGVGRPGGADGVLYDSQQELSETGSPKPPPEVKSWRAKS